MGKETLIIFLGAWVAVQSFLGFPLEWDVIVLAILGVAILGLGILLRRDAIARRAPRARRTEVFVENMPREETVLSAEEILPQDPTVQA